MQVKKQRPAAALFFRIRVMPNVDAYKRANEYSITIVVQCIQPKKDGIDRENVCFLFFCFCFGLYAKHISVVLSILSRFVGNNDTDNTIFGCQVI